MSARAMTGGKLVIRSSEGLARFALRGNGDYPVNTCLYVRPGWHVAGGRYGPGERFAVP